MNEKRVDIVVAKYEEDISWTKGFTKSNVIIYDKSDSPAEGHISLSNVGREAHTYLHHIVENYDRLADYTCFLQGNPYDGVKGNLNRDFEFIENFSEEVCYFPLSYMLICDLEGMPHHPELNVKEITDTYFDEMPDQIVFTVGAQFIASRDGIRSRKKEFYERLINDFHSEKIVFSDGKNRLPWIMERLWLYMFNEKIKTKYDSK